MSQGSSRNRSRTGPHSMAAEPVSGAGSLPAPGMHRPTIRWAVLVLVMVVVFVYLLILRGYGLPEAAGGVLTVGLAATEITRRLALTSAAAVRH